LTNTPPSWFLQDGPGRTIFPVPGGGFTGRPFSRRCSSMIPRRARNHSLFAFCLLYSLPLSALSLDSFVSLMSIPQGFSLAFSLLSFHFFVCSPPAPSISHVPYQCNSLIGHSCPSPSGVGYQTLVLFHRVFVPPGLA